MKAQLIAVVGGSGSGKTWLADRLVAGLDGMAGRLALDDFYRDLSHMEVEAREKTNFDQPGAIDWPLFHRVLSRLKKGESVEIPVYDFGTHTRSGVVRRWIPRPLVVLDGLWLLRRRELRELWAFSVFVECEEETRLARRLERDQHERNRSLESIRHQFAHQVSPMHRRYISGQAVRADLIVHTDEVKIRMPDLVNRCRQLLSGQKVRS